MQQLLSMNRARIRLLFILSFAFLFTFAPTAQQLFAQVVPPDAVPLTATTNEDTPVTINTTVPHDAVFIVVRQNSANGPAHGTVSQGPVIGGNFTINYTPGANRTDAVSFDYAFCQASTVQNCGTTATVDVAITPVNDPPTANDDGSPTPIDLQEDNPLLIDVLANDSADPDMGDTLSVSDVVSPTSQGGTTEIIANEVLYTPPQDFCGADDFQYTIQDSQGLTDNATVFLNVVCVNDPPVAVDDEHSTGEDFPINIDVINGLDITNGGALDVSGIDSTGPTNESAQTLTIVAVSDPANGSTKIDTINNSIIYTPTHFFNGVDTFTYTISDNGTPPLEDTATVTMTVDPLPNQPMLTIDGPHSIGDHRFSIDVILTSPDQNVSSLDYRLRYSNLGCLIDPDDPADGLSNNVSNMPTAGEGFYSQVQDEFIGAPLLHFVSAAQPPANSGDPLEILAGPDGPVIERIVSTVEFMVDPSCVDANGDVTVALVFGNQREFGDEDSNAIVGGIMVNALLTVHANEAPTAMQLNPAAVIEGVAGASAGLLSTTDPDSSDTHTYTLLPDTAANHNNRFVLMNGRELLLKPNVTANFEALPVYTVSILTTDPYGGELTMDFAVNVINANEPPTAVDDGGLAPIDRIPVVGPTDIDVLANDTDPDVPSGLSVLSVTNGANGMVVNNGTNVTFIPTNASYRGPDSFTYTLQDSGGITDDAQVFVSIRQDWAPGDCNGDGFVRAADMTALGNELFDGDDNSKWYTAAGGSFAGSPYGCNANANSSIDAGDFICIANFIFGRPCNPIVLASNTTAATLAVGSNLIGTPGSTVSIPIVLQGDGHAVAAAAFAVNFDSNSFDFESAELNAPDGLLTDISFNAEDSRVEIVMAGMSPPYALFDDGLLATVNLTVKSDVVAGDSAVTLSHSSLGNEEGQEIPLEISDGTISIEDAPEGQVVDTAIFIPLISR